MFSIEAIHIIEGITGIIALIGGTAISEFGIPKGIIKTVRKLNIF